MNKFTIDINCDVGEGIGNEEQLFPLISSCNIACGGHAGDMESMAHVIRLAKQHHVKIGAHPSYPDKENFGRISVKMKPEDFQNAIRDQVSQFEKILRQEAAELHHIKPHGALYNDLARDPVLVKNFIEAIEPFISEAKLYVPFGSAIAEIAKKRSIDIVYEAFADRNYCKDLSLVSRSDTNALIDDPKIALEHVIRMVKQGKVRTAEGDLIDIKAETFCIHGDTPSALQILMYLAEELPRQHIAIAK